MGFWIAEPKLEPGETVTYMASANRLSSQRMLGGKVLITDRRVMFYPNRMDSLLRGKSIDLPIADVKSIRTNPRGWQSIKQRGLGALIRDQVEIEGVTETLIVTVSNPNALIGYLE